MNIIDYINMLPNGDMSYGVPKVVPNPNCKIPPVDRVPALREFNVNGHTIMARNRKDAIKTAVRKGIVADKKKKRK